MCALIDQEIKYCPRCASLLEWGERFGRQRLYCPQCDWTHFADPKVAVAALIEQEDRILLVRRANDPQRGLWTLPAGFIDAGEDPREALARECLEETGLTVRPKELFDVLYGQEHPRGAHILIVYHAQVISGTSLPGDDVDGVGFFGRDDLPPLAFSTTQKILRKLMGETENAPDQPSKSG